MAAAAQAEEALGLGLHVAPVAGNDVAADERVAERLQLVALGAGMEHRRPHGHEDRRVPGRGQPDEAAQGMERAVGVARARAAFLRLGPLHDGRATSLVEAEDLAGALEDHTHLVVVLTAGKAGAVRSRPDLDEEDRRAGQGRRRPTAAWETL
jgi:hypothetical protein